MTERTVTNQADLDTALADEDVTTIHIDSPAGVWLRIGDTGGTLVNIGGKSTVDRLSGSVGTISGSGRVDTISGSGRVDTIYGSGSVGTISDSGSVGTIYDSGSVGTISGSGRVDTISDSGRVGTISDSGRVEKARGAAVIQGVRDNAVIVDAGPYVAIHVYSATATINGGVLIDLTHLDELSGVDWCDAMGIDYQRLQAELEYITTHPAEWNQRLWARRSQCGTAYCLAGGAVLRAGIALKWDSDDTASYTERGVPISTEASRLFGLSILVASPLFDAENSLADLWRIAAQITHNAIQVPDLAVPSAPKGQST